MAARTLIDQARRAGFVVPSAILLLGVASAGLGEGAYRVVTGEDGIAETVQVGCYLVAAVLAGSTAAGWWRRGERAIAVLFGLFLLGLVFLVGEEISWGQRLLDWETPAAFRELNGQQETNLHNIDGVQELFKWLQLAVGGFGLFAPLLLHRWRAPDRLARVAGAVVPPLHLAASFGVMFVWRLYRNLLPAPDDLEYALQEFNEVVELVLAVAMARFAWWARARQRNSGITCRANSSIVSVPG